MNIDFSKLITAEEKQAKQQSATIAQLTAAIQRHLDETARSKNYDGILSLCTYATSTNPIFAAEGQAGLAWRDAVWTASYEIMDEVLAGERPVPTAEELIDLLPSNDIFPNP